MVTQKIRIYSLDRKELLTIMAIGALPVAMLAPRSW